MNKFLYSKYVNSGKRPEATLTKGGAKLAAVYSLDFSRIVFESESDYVDRLLGMGCAEYWHLVGEQSSALNATGTIPIDGAGPYGASFAPKLAGGTLSLRGLGQWLKGIAESATFTHEVSDWPPPVGRQLIFGFVYIGGPLDGNFTRCVGLSAPVVGYKITARVPEFYEATRVLGGITAHELALDVWPWEVRDTYSDLDVNMPDTFSPIFKWPPLSPTDLLPTIDGSQYVYALSACPIWARDRHVFNPETGEQYEFSQPSWSGVSLVAGPPPHTPISFDALSFIPFQSAMDLRPECAPFAPKFTINGGNTGFIPDDGSEQLAPDVVTPYTNSPLSLANFTLPITGFLK